jgi:hypothetical protein
MFSFRRDKAGFFITIILLTIVAGTAISTLVLLIIGIVQGDWKAHLLSVKWVLGSAWVACIFIVLIRLKIFKWQYDRTLARRAAESDSKADERTADASRSPE